MKRVFIWVTLLVTMIVQSNAQDVIVKRDGSTIISKVLEVNTGDIKYKKFSNLDGPTYTIDKADVMAINYENGEKDVFETQNATSQTPQVQSQDAVASAAGFSPATGMNAADIEKAVNAKNPYTLFKKGSVAEYYFQYKGKLAQYMGGPTYIQQIVDDAKIEKGLYVAYIRQAFLNKKHEPSKGIPASAKEYLFPVEMDIKGTYHLTHNIAQDYFLISNRRGYGVLIPGDMEQGMQLQSSTLYDNAKNALGGIVKIETAYSNWQVVGQDKITTPAGTFDCVKLTGRLAQKQGSSGKFFGENITCWMARGIGMVQYETVSESSKNKEPFVIYLNKIDIK